MVVLWKRIYLVNKIANITSYDVVREYKKTNLKLAMLEL